MADICAGGGKHEAGLGERTVWQGGTPMNEKGILIIISGFSGAGKGTIVKELIGRYDNYALSVSATTRPPRKGEAEGREYFFKTKQEFEKMIAEEELLEYARYVDNYYGTPQAYVEEQLGRGKDVILEIEIQGALKIKEKAPDAVLLFVMPPSAKELKKRLVRRGTEDAEGIALRLRRACEEAEGIGNYDYVVINNELEACVGQVHGILLAEHQRTVRNAKFLEDMKKELRELE